VVKEDDWNLVAHMSVNNPGHMFEGNTDLSRYNQYNCPGARDSIDPKKMTPTTPDLQCRFDDYNADIIFVTGDGSIWAKTNYIAIIKGYWGENTQAPTTVFQRCANGTEEFITGNVLNKEILEDQYNAWFPEYPWVSIADGTHMDGFNTDLIIWGENNFSGLHEHLKDTHGGINVYICRIVCELDYGNHIPAGVFNLSILVLCKMARRRIQNM
jgi:hypothetical protein